MSEGCCKGVIKIISLCRIMGRKITSDADLYHLKTFVTKLDVWSLSFLGNTRKKKVIIFLLRGLGVTNVGLYAHSIYFQLIY